MMINERQKGKLRRSRRKMEKIFFKYFRREKNLFSLRRRGNCIPLERMIILSLSNYRVCNAFGQNCDVVHGSATGEGIR